MDNEVFKTYQQSLKDFLKTTDGSTFNICAQLYSIIKMADEIYQPILFEEAINLYEDINSSEIEPVLVSPYENQLEFLKQKFGDLVNSFIEFFVQQKDSKQVFYKKMWNTIQDEVFFPDEASKVFAFYYVLIDRRVPYYELMDGYQMSDQAYKELRYRNRELSKKIRYILSTEIQQKTERASIILNELGIGVPNSEDSFEVVEEYERKLIVIIDILNMHGKDSTSPIGALLQQLKDVLPD